MARPRVFVSSTYYDLKYVRERIERFISAYNMEPILFESDDVYFNPMEAIDDSCYDEVKNCQMMVLIIGGRYGSLATSKEEYEKRYVSVTQKEYNTARSKGIPVMIFVDANVYSEYRTYQKNRTSLPKDFKFAHVDDIRVFEFVSSVEQQAIKTFSKIEDIELYFLNQISGMLYSYLIQQQSVKADKEITSAVEQLNYVSKSMQLMLNSVAEKVLGNENGQYDELIRKQNHDLIDFFMELFEQNFEVYPSKENDQIKGEIKGILMEKLFNKSSVSSLGDSEKWILRQEKVTELENDTIEVIMLTIPCTAPPILNIHNFIKQLVKINELISSDNELREYFEKKLEAVIDWGCYPVG